MAEVITDNTAKQNLAANLKRLLEARGLRQSDLAEMTGESEMSISRICRGLQSPTIGVTARIAEALDVSIDRLVAEPQPLAHRTAS